MNNGQLDPSADLFGPGRDPGAGPVKPTVLVPGRHEDPRGDGPTDVGNDDFRDAVLAHLPTDVFYRSTAGVVGVIGGPAGRKAFRPVTVEEGMAIVDRHLRLVRVAQVKGYREEHFKPCTKGQSALVVDAARSSARVRELKAIFTYSAYGPDMRLLPRGWSDGNLYDPPADLSAFSPIRDPAEIRRVLINLTIDFPFRAEIGPDGRPDAGAANRENYVGLLLTIMLRPSIPGNVPPHHVEATGERTGKTKLAGDVTGLVFQGQELPVTRYTDDETELKKELFSALIEGSPIVNIDNLSGHINSPTLASLFTARAIKDRLLGGNQMFRATNDAVYVTNGNNVTFSPEVTLRIMPIRLRSLLLNPEKRTTFIHQNLLEFVMGCRCQVLGALAVLMPDGRAVCPVWAPPRTLYPATCPVPAFAEAVSPCYHVGPAVYPADHPAVVALRRRVIRWADAARPAPN